MTNQEKKAFEHGCRITLKLMEGATNEATALGRPDHANFLLGVVDCAEEELKNIVQMYAYAGYDDLLKMITIAAIVPEE